MSDRNRTGEAMLTGSERVSAPTQRDLDLAFARQQAARQRIETLLAPPSDAVRAALAELAQAEGDLKRALDAGGAHAPHGFQSQKLEAIGQLTGGVAHDFNNLLTVITSGLQLLARTTDEERRRELTRRIEEAAWRGADLTRRLLAFARRQPLNAEPLEVGPHLNGLTELLRHGVREHVRIVSDVPAGTWPVEADLAALELALLNLGVNASDAMPQGGTMVLGARNVPADSGIPERLGLSGRDFVELFVTDTGHGMSPEVLSRVFEPFFTTKPPGKGTGLGLAQVYGFARQSGGAATVQSAPGHGTTVSIFLPRASRLPEHRAAEQPAQPSAPRRKEQLSILVVEDDDTVAAVVLEMLTQLGHKTVRVSSLPAAIAALSGGDRVDLIFTDVLLGSGGSGLDLAREAGRRHPQIPVVLTSGYGGGVTARLAAARLPFLRKPYKIEALRQVLDEAMGRSAPARGSPHLV